MGDRSRIVDEDGLKKYFKDTNQVKYFNPIALVILPTNNQGDIEKTLPKLVEKQNIEFDGIKGKSLTNTDFYRLYIQGDEGNIGKIEWDSEKCDVVAIDGQHRLTALKELYEARRVNQQIKDIENWQIPVVFIIINKKVPTGKSDDMIQIIRKIFMYINMKAEKVNDSRSIMLNDESIECLCVQELLSAFHQNEFSDDQKDTYPPMYLLDWLGDNKESILLKDTRYLFSNIELRNWIREYLIGEDFKAWERKTDKLQMRRLELQDIELDFLKDITRLSQSDAGKIRKKFNQLIGPYFIHFLTSLEPISNYIEECKHYENENSEDDAQMTAFSQLRYGYTTKSKSNVDEIETFENAFKVKFIALKKNQLSEFMRQDISMRGFVYAYSELYDIYKGIVNKELGWSEYTNLFLPAFNDLIKSGWCEDYESLDPHKKEMLTHICHSDVGKRINYKLHDVKNAWGIFVIMSILDYSSRNNLFRSADMCKQQTWELMKDRFESTLQKGFRDIAKREADQKPMRQDERLHYINTQKEKLAKDGIKKFEELWDIG